MNKAQNRIKSEIFKNIFDSMEQVIYIADPESYEILYVNNLTNILFPGDIIGTKCYKTFQNLDSPCPFCTNNILFGKDPITPYIWDFHNQKINRWFHIIDQSIKWEGKNVRFEMAEDITSIK